LNFRRKIMINKSKLALIAVLAVGMASPAFAQSFNQADGTGNVLPFAYSVGGARPVYGPTAFSARESNTGSHAPIGIRGLYDYAPLPSAAQSSAAANSVAAAGGGSVGYNAMVEIH
jgi:hypothetical protein